MTQRVAVQGLAPSSTYVMRVRAKNGDIVSEWSSVLAFTTISDIYVPVAPSNVTWVVVDDSFHAEWDASTVNTRGDAISVTRYEIELVAGATTKVVSVAPATGTRNTFDLSFAQNKALFGSAQPQVKFRVLAVDNKNLKSVYTSQFTATNPAPAAPSAFTATGGTGTIDLKWTPPADTDVIGYNLYLGATLIWSGNATRFTYQTVVYTSQTFTIKTVDKFIQESTGASASATAASPFVVDNTPPGAPTSCSVTTGYDTTRKEAYLDVSWTPPADTDLQNYTIRYGPASSGPWVYDSVERDVTTARVYVNPGQQYYVNVRAIDYSGNPSTWATVTGSPITGGADTTPPPTLAAPTVTTQGTSFLVTWTASTANDLKEYEVGVTYSGGTEVFYRTSATRFDFPLELNRAAFGTPKASIIVRVRAIDFGGLGTFSTTTTGTNAAPTAPTALTATLGANAITVAWTAPSDTDLLGYNVYMGTSASPSTKIAQVDTTNFTITVTAAQYFTIKALDVFGQESSALSGGPFTPTNPFLVDTTAPAVPTALAAAITINTSGLDEYALVSWTAPTDTDLAGYRIRYRRSSTADNYTSLNVGKDLTSIKVDLPLAYQNYDFQILAYDTSGNQSAYSSAVTATAPSNTAPANIASMASVVGKDNIVYSWTQVADTDIKNYEVTFSTSSTFASGNTTYLTGTASTLSVSGLTPGTTYYARVRAVDALGLTSASWSATNTSTTTTYSTNSSDGVAPTSSPTPTITSGLGYLFANWTATTNNDPVTYEVHLSTTTGFTPSGTTKVFETQSTFGQIKNLPGTTTPLTYGTTYYVKIIAKDRDGAAAAGTQASGVTAQVAAADIVVGTITAASGIIANLAIGTAQIIDAAITSAKIANLAVTNAQIANATITSAKIADLAVDKLTAGTIGGGIGITMAGSSSILLNGGYIKSNTYTGTSYSGTASAGFYLGNDGLRIAQGSVSAAALATGTMTATTITIGSTGTIQSSNYAAGSAGWILSQNGLEINGGTISAAALSLQSGPNIIQSQFSLFELPLSYYNASSNMFVSNATVSLTAVAPKFGTQSLTLTNLGGAPFYALLGPSGVYYQIPITGGQDYILSGYVRNRGAVSTGIQIGLTWSDITQLFSPITTPTVSSNTWVRVVAVGTAPSAATGVQGFVYSPTTTAGAQLDIVGVQIEPRTSAAAVPSTFTPPGVTTIDGGVIRTGSIQSTSLTGISGTPLWSIPLNGSATFQNLLVRGASVVGASGDAASSYLSSFDYVSGSAGWRIFSTGASEFNSITVRGNIQGNSSSVISGGTFTGGVFQTNATSNSVVRINSAGIVANNASGTQIFFVDGTTGNQTIAGTTTIQGTTSLGGTLTVAGGISVTGTPGTAYIRGGGFSGTASSGASGNGYILDNNGLYVGPNSVVTAGSLQIQQGSNLLPPQWTDFELTSTYYIGNNLYTDATVTLDTTNKRFSTQSLKMVSVAANKQIYFASAINNLTTLNLDPSTTYIVSWYAMVPSTAVTTTITPNFRRTGSVDLAGTGQSATNNNVWTRYSTTITTDASTGAADLWFGVGTASTVYFDGIQVEKKLGAVNTPSPWTSGASTTIDGAMIRTGSIVSTAIAQVWDTTANPIGTSMLFNTVNASTQLNSVAALFASTDVGKAVSGAGIPAGTTVVAFLSSSAVTMSAAATATAINVNGFIYRTFAGGYKPDPNNAPAWSINTTGSAVFGNAAVQGALVIGTTSTPNVTQQGYMASATYSPGVSGWILRADGTAELRSLVAGSLNGNAVEPGTLAAEAIVGGTITSSISLAGAFQTTSSPVTFTITTTSGSAVVTTSAGIFYPDDVGVTITASGVPAASTIIAYTSGTSVTLSANATASGTVTATIYRGRKVSISGTDGIRLFNAAGTSIVEIPTDPSRPAKFSGSLYTNDIYVTDQFRLYGQNNSLGSNAALVLNPGNYIPPAPSITSDWNLGQLNNAYGIAYNPSTDPYVSTPTCFKYDPVTGRYYWIDIFYGTNVIGHTQGTGTGINAYPITYNSTKMSAGFVWGDNDWAAGGWTQNASNFYFLTYNQTAGTFTSRWALQGITRTGFNRAGGPVVGDRVSIGSPTWYGENHDNGVYGYPALALAPSGVFYTAKVSNDNLLIIYKHTSTDISTVAYGSVINSGCYGSVVSLEIGQFDYGTGSTYVAITFQSISGNHFVEVVRDTGSTFVNDGFSWAPAASKSPLGTTWVGTSGNDTTGYFKGFSNDGLVYDYTKLARNDTSTIITAQMAYRYDGVSGGTSGIGQLGPTSTASTFYVRRSRLNISLPSSVVIPNTGLGPNGYTPDAITFYAGTNTIYKFPETGTMVTTLAITDLRSSNATGTSGTLGAGNPAKITAGTALSIDGNGDILARHVTATGSGWTALPYAANWSNAGFGWQAGQYRLVGNLLQIRGLVARSTSASGASATIATLPVGFRPTGGIQLISDIWSTGAAYASNQVTIDTAGVISTAVSIPAGQFCYVFGQCYID